ncbi:nucleotidyltransferase family protein [Agrobacterium sp.]|uniref:nucleotidyltransferase family protein n=1 Tax=Agrobacterium sp. TaxID=361 RepID=UPI0028B20D98|nr:nucleotidyltransferase family protein [Agrobacterium sp.]
MMIGGLLLAAGQSKRIEGGYHKLLAKFAGVSLVHRSALTMLEAGINPIVAVTGHRREEIETELRDLPIAAVYNESFAKGIGTSMACGFGHQIVAPCDGVLIMLADMPEITSAHIQKLLDVFALGGAKMLCVDPAGPNTVIPSSFQNPFSLPCRSSHRIMAARPT